MPDRLLQRRRKGTIGKVAIVLYLAAEEWRRECGWRRAARMMWLSPGSRPSGDVHGTLAASHWREDGLSPSATTDRSAEPWRERAVSSTSAHAECSTASCHAMPCARHCVQRETDSGRPMGSPAGAAHRSAALATCTPSRKCRRGGQRDKQQQRLGGCNPVPDVGRATKR